MPLTRRTVMGSAAAALAAPAGASPARIDVAGFVKVGGIDQWVEVHGRSGANPVMLFLHGGPGEAMSPFPEVFRPYEDDFTVAVWDQRGSGKTYARSGGDKTPGMELEQFIRDGIEMAEALRARYGKSKIMLCGHSWGAALGLYVAQRRPDLFHVFVGTGQPVSNALAIPSDERHARAVLTARGDAAALKKLDDVAGLAVTDNKRRFATRAFSFGDEDKTFLAREEAFAPDPDKATGDAGDWAHGYEFTSNIFVPKILGHETVDIVGYDIRVPFVVIQGRDDWICPTDVARDYLAKVKAPGKAFAEIRGGHFACYTDQPQFLAAFAQACSEVLSRRVIAQSRDIQRSDRQVRPASSLTISVAARGTTSRPCAVRMSMVRGNWRAARTTSLTRSTQAAAFSVSGTVSTRRPSNTPEAASSAVASTVSSSIRVEALLKWSVPGGVCTTREVRPMEARQRARLAAPTASVRLDRPMNTASGVTRTSPPSA